MAGRLQAEIKQRKPFASAELEAFLNLQRTADALARGLAEVLKPAGVSGPSTTSSASCGAPARAGVRAGSWANGW